MSWSAPLRSLGAIYRLSALVVALVWATAPVLAVLHSHSSGEVHRYCAEHRILEDVSPDQDQAPASEGGNAVVRESEAARPHGGCAFARFCRFGELLSGFVWETARGLEAAPIVAPAVRVAPAAIAVIVVAPKTSPPV